MAKVIGAKGLHGVDVTTENGTKKYNADKGGLIEVDNQKHIKQMVSEGFAVAGLFSGIGTQGFACTNCGFNSVFKKFDCPKCSTANDHREPINDDNGD